jgi:hypothetical protein
MEHFSIVQAICRSALAGASPATRHQVERLKEALAAAGAVREAASIAGLLTASERSKEAAPSRLSRARGAVGGEVLTPNTLLPVDKESGAPLADIIFPETTGEDAPIFPPRISNAIDSLVDEWSHARQLGLVGISPANTCLIYGPPGVGKTRLALWIAQRAQLPVILARIDGLMSSFLGTTSRNIAALFAFANRYRAILLLDEFDAIAKLRDDPHEVGEIKRVVNTLLQNLDSRALRGVTIGLTNHPALLDPAIWRRFEVQLEIPVPNFATRLAITARYMAPTDPPESHMKFIAWLTEGASGAEVELAVRTYKKAHVIGGDAAKSPIATFRQFATLNVGRVSAQRRQLLFGNDQELSAALQHDADLSFTKADLAEIHGVHKSTISRRSRAISES